MLWKIKENKTLKEMLIGIGISAVIGVVIILIATKQKGYNVCGLLIGMLGAIFMGVHMALTIEDALLFDEKTAISYIRKQTYIRYAVACILVIAVGVTNIASPVAAVFGLLLLKPGAYLQPLVHKILHPNEDKIFTDAKNQVIMEKVQSNAVSDSCDEPSNQENE